MMKYAVVGAVAAALWFAPDTNLSRPSPVSQERQDTWSWRGRVAAGGTVEIRGVNGSISAEAATGSEVEVTAEKHGRRSDPDEVRIEVVEHQGGVTICAVYPGRRNRCEPGGGEMSVRDNDVEVDFTVRVPRGVGFSGHNVNGGVDAVDVAGPVEAETVNGGVRIETAGGEAAARTVNGSVTAVVRSRGSGELHFQTVNGGVTLSLPADADLDLEAETVNGSITTDFPIQVSGRFNPRRLSGRIGQGGRRLHVETVNGSIRIRSLR
jgi:hypothetical protein